MTAGGSAGARPSYRTVSENCGKLRKALLCVAGRDEEAQKSVLRRYSAFTPGDGEEVYATDVGRMSDKWARVTLERLLDAVKNGEEHFHFDENGTRVQLKLFG